MKKLVCFKKASKTLCLLAFASLQSIVFAQQSHVLFGTLTDSKSKEQLANVLVRDLVSQQTTSTNAYGYFSLSVKADSAMLFFTYTGYTPDTLRLNIAEGNINLGQISLSNNPTMLKEVIVSSSRGSLRANVQSTQMGVISLPISMLKQVPALFGEVDIIKALQLTPGIKRGGEGGIGMFVRGGNTDENLILLDEATVYNAGHLLGFFSVFNSNALKTVDLYKSSFPAEYGGRLSSVMDVRMKEGDMQNFHADGSVGFISSNITLQGPIAKNKVSFIVSARRTYIDFVLGNKIPYHFYDVNGKINYKINDRNHLYISGYKGDDVLRKNAKNKNTDSSGLGTDELRTSLNLGNEIASVRWNHLYKDPRLFSNFTLHYTKFRYDVSGAIGTNELLMASAIRDIGTKADFTYKITHHDIHFGATYINHRFNPNIVNASGSISDAIKTHPGTVLYNSEAAVYVNDDYNFSDKLKLNGGLRFSSSFAKAKLYTYVEPRMSGRYLINQQQSVKLSYARMVQYMHLVSSSSIALPTDLWYPVTAGIKPGISDQLSAGYYYNIPSLNIALSAEAYYKWLHHLVEYREGAVLLLNNNFEKELVTGKGKAYGLELFASHTTGKLTGWVGYALSWSTRRFDSLNDGKQYFAKYDRRHDLSIVASYNRSKRWTFSAAFVYSTGSPFTAQTGSYILPNPSFTNIDIVPVYGSRNGMRLSGSNRLDLDAVDHFTINKKIKADLHLGCYNFYNRAQPGRVERDIDYETGEVKYVQRGLFGFIPGIALNFSF